MKLRRVQGATTAVVTGYVQALALSNTSQLRHISGSMHTRLLVPDFKVRTRHEGLIDRQMITQPHPHSIRAAYTYLNRFTKRDEERWHAKVLRRVVVSQSVVVVRAAAGTGSPAIPATAVPTCSREGGHRGQAEKGPEGHRPEVTSRDAWHSRCQHGVRNE